MTQSGPAMGLNLAAIRSGQSGGLDLHRSFLAPGCVYGRKLQPPVICMLTRLTPCRQQPPELKCLRTATASGKISAGTQHWLPTKDPPNDAWLSPGELLLPFRYTCQKVAPASMYSFSSIRVAKRPNTYFFHSCLEHCPSQGHYTTHSL